jgi:hypothetical protein
MVPVLLFYVLLFVLAILVNWQESPLKPSPTIAVRQRCLEAVSFNRQQVILYEVIFKRGRMQILEEKQGHIPNDETMRQIFLEDYLPVEKFHNPKLRELGGYATPLGLAHFQVVVFPNN